MAERKKLLLVKAVAGNKRAESSQHGVANEILKVSAMVPVEARPQKVVTNALVVVLVYPVITRGKYTWSLQVQATLNKCIVIVRVRSMQAAIKASVGNTTFKVIDCAGDLWAAYEDIDEKLCQV